MFVFIAHAESDQAAADDLKAFLKARGLVTETETGAKGFRHLQASDVVVALWSQKSVFGTHRMMMERRMFDAWADGRLVLVKLDHGFLPVGLRDLPAIDAGFESGRKLSVWPQVERAVREAMNRALVAAQEELSESLRAGRRLPEQPASAEEEPRERMGVGSGGPPPAAAPSRAPVAYRSARPDASGDIVRPAQQVDEAPARFASKRGSPLPGLLILVALGALGWAGWRLIGQPAAGDTMTYVAYGAAAAGGLLLLILLGWALAPRKSTTSKATKAPAAPAPAAPAPAAEAAHSLLFISYAHADNDAVEPVVAVVQQAGRPVWIDKTGIQSGDGWAGEIVRAIKGAKGVLVMCSPRAFESDHIKREVYLADRYRKPMLPVFIAEAQPPEDFEYFFASVQWLELFKLPEAERPAAIGKALAAV